jgi:hypothetical protein
VRVGGWLGSLSRLVLGTLLTIVALLATLETSSRLDYLPLMRWDLLSLWLLHLLSRCTILSWPCLACLLRLPRRLSTCGVVGHPLDNLHLLSLQVTRRPRDPPLVLSLSLSVMLQSLHSNGSIHQCIKSLIVPSIQLVQDAREAMVEAVPLLLIRVNMSPSILCEMVEFVSILHHGHAPLLQVQELGHLPVKHPYWNVVLSKGSGELLPSHRMTH